jgi:hypothetical protein
MPTASAEALSSCEGHESLRPPVASFHREDNRSTFTSVLHARPGCDYLVAPRRLTRFSADVRGLGPRDDRLVPFSGVLNQEVLPVPTQTTTEPYGRGTR